MMAPLGWLERVPTYRDQQQKLADKDLATYGFLGYPLLGGRHPRLPREIRPVGEDQVPHLEFAREVARRFNHLYGREPGFEDKAKAAVKKMGTKKARLLNELRTKFLEQGDAGRSRGARRCSTSSRTSRAATASGGWLEGTGKKIWSSRRRCSPRRPRCPASTGRRCRSPTATPSRCARSGGGGEEDQDHAHRPGAGEALRSGNPEVPGLGCTRCTPTRRKDWVMKGCTTAGIGCLECKQPVIDAINLELAPMRGRARAYLDDPALVKNIIADGCEKAKRLAAETMRDVREAMGLSYA